MPKVNTISVQELQQLLVRVPTLLLLDVRGPEEWLFCRIAGAHHLPMSEVEQRVGELDPAQPTFVYCHPGVRSYKVAEFLIGKGFDQVTSLTGGIDAWSVSVDSTVPRY